MEEDTVMVEDRKVSRGAAKGQVLAIFNSGGDAQGMNAAVRSCLRLAMFLDYKVYLIREGYQGMIDGGDKIFQADWKDGSDILHLGGTVLGSSRCPMFHERSARLKAAYNLVNLGITNLVGIGGDGTLAGLNVFKKEWHLLITELVETSRVSTKTSPLSSQMNVVGIVASIDNDFIGTDITIGSDTALNRIVYSMDNLQTTATSMQRCFVLELMGKSCGYLTVSAALAIEADWMFIPESPPEKGWEDSMCERLTTAKEMGQKMSLVVLAEGAVDISGKPITSAQIKEVIVENLKFETRISVLGYMQRGGSPTAYDRILASRLGASAILCLLDYSLDSIPQVIGMEGNTIIRIPLVKAVNETRLINVMLKEKDYENALKARSSSFQDSFNFYKVLSRAAIPAKKTEAGEKAKHFVMGMMCLGPLAFGMNAAIRTFVRYVVKSGYSVYAIHHGFEGLMQNHVDVIKWEDVNGWSAEGGSNIGTSSVLIDHFGVDKIAAQMRKYKIAALVIIGGFEAFYSALVMAEMRHRYLEFCIPISVIPASNSNCIPGTDISLGSDSCLNEIMNMCDRTRLAASGGKNKVHICETQGGKCGYLSTMSALTTGADASYIFEEAHGIRELMTDLVHMAIKIRNGIPRGLVLKSNESNEIYNLDFLTRLYQHEGRSTFVTKSILFGDLQEGGRPSPFDRIYATKLAVMCAEQLINQLSECVSPTGVVNTLSPETCSLVGFQKKTIAFSTIQELKKQFNFQHRIPRDDWWMRLRPLARVLSTHDSVYWFDNAEKVKEEEPKGTTTENKFPLATDKNVPIKYGK